MLFGRGFGLMNPRIPFTPSPGAFYWGGSIAVVDPDTRTSIASVMNKMDESTLGDQRSARIIAATYAALQTMTGVTRTRRYNGDNRSL